MLERRLLWEPRVRILPPQPARAVPGPERWVTDAECVPKNFGFSSMLAIHSETSDAHCRAVMHSSMPHRCAVHRISVWGNVLDLETYDIAAAQLAIDGQ